MIRVIVGAEAGAGKDSDMAKATWNVDVNGTPHQIVLEWSYWGGERTVTVDGKTVQQDDQPMRWQSNQMFEIESESFTVVTKPQKVNIGAFDVELHRGEDVLEPDIDDR